MIGGKKMKKEIINFIVSLLLIIIGSLIGMRIESVRQNKEVKEKYIEYSVSVFDEFINKPKLGKETIEILLNNKSIENITSIEIDIYNRNNKDFENVKLFYELGFNKPDTEKIEIINNELYSNYGLPKESIIPLQDVINPEKNKGIRFGYEIKNLNKSDSFKPSFTSRILLIGSLSPKISVEILKPGLRIRPKVWEPSDSSLNVVKITTVLLIVLILIFLFVNFSDKITQKYAFDDLKNEINKFEIYNSEKQKVDIKDFIIHFQPIFRKILSFKYFFSIIIRKIKQTN